MLNCKLRLEGITKRFGEFVANDNISLGVEAGSIHAMMRSLFDNQSRFLSIRISGEEVAKARSRRVKQDIIAYIPEDLTCVRTRREDKPAVRGKSTEYSRDRATNF